MAVSAPKLSGINLVGIKGRYMRQIFPLPGQGATVGRESDNDLVLAGSSLSRRHARFEPGSDGGWWIEDIESANGTWVNNNRLEGRTPLAHGDRIRLAQDDFLFVDADNHKFDSRGYQLAEKETVTLGKLLFDRGNGPEELLLEEPTVTIGREDTNDIVLALAGVSGNHCKIRSVDETFTLVDLKSTNGTYIEGTEDRVDEVVLKAGMVFLVGNCRIQFATEEVTRAKAEEARMPMRFQNPSMVDVVLPVAAAFLVLLTVLFAVLIALRPPAHPTQDIDLVLPPPATQLEVP